MHFVCIFFVLFHFSVADFTCQQICSKAGICSIALLNDTCLYSEKTSCITDERTKEGENVRVEGLELTNDRKTWTISWALPNRYHYNGFIITILTDTPKVYTYYSKVSYSSSITISCTEKTDLPKVSDVCVETLPKSAIFDNDVRTCLSDNKWAPILTNRSPTIIKAIAVTRGKTSETNSSPTIIGAIVVAITIICSVTIGIVLYRKGCCIRYSKRQNEQESSPSTANNRIPSTQIADMPEVAYTSNKNCPIHGHQPDNERSTHNINKSQKRRQQNNNPEFNNKTDVIYEENEVCLTVIESSETTNHRQPINNYIDDLTDSERRLLRINFEP